MFLNAGSSDVYYFRGNQHTERVRNENLTTILSSPTNSLCYFKHILPDKHLESKHLVFKSVSRDISNRGKMTFLYQL